MSDNPKISVIMACYNCAKTVNKAIDSILAQTYDNWVMICCDDGSSDETVKILNEYKEKHSGKFVIIQNEENKKLPFSLNHCLEYVETELVARMDADDWSSPDRFEKQVAFMKEHRDVDLLGTGIIVSDGTKTLTTIIQPAEPEPKDMLHCNCFSHATIMTYKRVYDALDGYSLEPYVERCEDLDLWSRFFAAGFKGYNIPDELYTILEDENAVKRRDFKNRLNTAKTLRKAFKRMGLKGFACFKKAYFQIFTYFVPMPIYKKLHVWKMKQRSERNSETSEK
ncbi:MAG: glycosyltransferase [Clostridia bacterium]|nr:glycosyltransferase [Clostridia bacterium]